MTLARSNGSAKREVAQSGMREAELQATDATADPDLPAASIASADNGSG
jgi:hypothetical protein